MLFKLHRDGTIGSRCDKMQTVLIVDDEEEIRDMIKTYLRREGIAWRECDHGKAALSILKREEIHLVILDIMMKDMDGFEVLKKIRESNPEVPVMFLSARQEEYDKVLGLGLGAEDYVTKPFSPGELMARVKVQLRRIQVSENRPEWLRYKEIAMNLYSYEVMVNERRIELAGKELLLLKFFLENPERVFTKRQIYHRVWDDSYEDDNTVMVYISHLRDKLEDNPKEPKWIRTIRGIGYRFGGRDL